MRRKSSTSSPTDQEKIQAALRDLSGIIGCSYNQATPEMLVGHALVGWLVTGKADILGTLPGPQKRTKLDVAIELGNKVFPYAKTHLNKLKYHATRAAETPEKVAEAAACTFCHTTVQKFAPDRDVLASTRPVHKRCLADIQNQTLQQMERGRPVETKKMVHRTAVMPPQLQPQRYAAH